MGNKIQEQVNMDGVTDNYTDVDKSKRKFSKAGMVAPVIMTLASKPVFAVQGLSNMLSTHGSATCRGDDFVGGMDPTFWADKTHIDDWKTAGFIYGPAGSAGSGGTVDLRFSSTRSLSQILNSQGGTAPSPETLNLIAGLLNASYYANPLVTENYFMTVTQYDEQYISFNPALGSSLGNLIASFYGVGTESCTP